MPRLPDGPRVFRYPLASTPARAWAPVPIRQARIWLPTCCWAGQRSIAAQVKVSAPSTPAVTPLEWSHYTLRPRPSTKSSVKNGCDFRDSVGRGCGGAASGSRSSFVAAGGARQPPADQAQSDIRDHRAGSWEKRPPTRLVRAATGRLRQTAEKMGALHSARASAPQCPQTAHQALPSASRSASRRRWSRPPLERTRPTKPTPGPSRYRIHCASV